MKQYVNRRSLITFLAFFLSLAVLSGAVVASAYARSVERGEAAWNQQLGHETDRAVNYLEQCLQAGVRAGNGIFASTWYIHYRNVAKIYADEFDGLKRIEVVNELANKVYAQPLLSDILIITPSMDSVISKSGWDTLNRWRQIYNLIDIDYSAGYTVAPTVTATGADSDMSYANSGLFLDLAPYYESLGFNIQKHFEKYPTQKGSLTTPAGGMYYVPTLTPADANMRCMMVNRLYLEQLGLTAADITDIDSLTDYLYKVKENDLNGNGNATDGIPLFIRAGMIGLMRMYWGIGGAPLRALPHRQDALVSGGRTARADRRGGRRQGGQSQVQGAVWNQGEDACAGRGGGAGGSRHRRRLSVRHPRGRRRLSGRIAQTL